MDSDNRPIDSAEYFQRVNPGAMYIQGPNEYLPTSGFSNLYPFITSSTIGSGQYSYPNMAYHTESFKNFEPSPSNRFMTSRFKWTEETKPDYSFSSNSQQPNALNVNDYAKSPMGTFGYKRKTKSPPPVPPKQHITEERMAEHLSQLHISSESEVYARESEPSRERRLYMCEEMQRLQAESIIPVQILEKVQRPCTALIPWKPSTILPTSVKENNNNNNEKEDEELDNMSIPTDDSVMDTGLYE